MAFIIVLIIAAPSVTAYLQLQLRGHINAKVVMKALHIGIQGYRTEYLRLPWVGDTIPTQDNQAYDTTDKDGIALLDILLSTDTKKNPRGIVFIDLPPSKSNGSGYTPASGLRDPWGKNGYRILLDGNGDGSITDPEGGTGALAETVLIYSAGPDGDFATWADNVCSWQ